MYLGQWHDMMLSTRLQATGLYPTINHATNLDIEKLSKNIYSSRYVALGTAQEALRHTFPCPVVHT